MSIELNLTRLADAATRIADALEELIATGTSAEPKEKAVVKKEPAKKPAAKKTPEPEPEEEEVAEEEAAEEEVSEADPLDDEDDTPKIDKEDVRKALMNYRDIEGSPAMLELLAEHGDGASGIKDLDEGFFLAVHTAAVKGSKKKK